jgi:hypothetical protein
VIYSGGNAYGKIVEAVGNSYSRNIWDFPLQCYWTLLGFFFGNLGNLRWMTHLILSVVFYRLGESKQCYHIQLLWFFVSWVTLPVGILVLCANIIYLHWLWLPFMILFLRFSLQGSCLSCRVIWYVPSQNQDVYW